MTSFTKADTNKMSWEEFGKLVDILIGKVQAFFSEHDQRLDVISQLHRTGGIIGSTMAIRMKIVPLLPVQFKYAYHPKRIEQIISVPDILVDVPEDMNILLCEGNTSSGSIAMHAAKVIKEKYPKAKIYLATLVKVFDCPEKLDGIEQIFYGVMSDEKFQATDEQKKKLGMREGITLFPWECAEDELAEVNGV